MHQKVIKSTCSWITATKRLTMYDVYLVFLVFQRQWLCMRVFNAYFWNLPQNMFKTICNSEFVKFSLNSGVSGVTFTGLELHCLKLIFIRCSSDYLSWHAPTSKSWEIIPKIPYWSLKFPKFLFFLNFFYMNSSIVCSNIIFFQIYYNGNTFH